MPTIPVELPQNSYNIEIGAGHLDDLGNQMRSLGLKDKVLLVSNSSIFRHLGQRAIESLKNAGFTVETCILPAGERYKTLSTLQKIYDAALENRLERSSTIVALGAVLLEICPGLQRRRGCGG